MPESGRITPNRTVSVVIPVRNEAARIGACIDGILGQTVAVTEIVVVDSGSTDGTLEILARYPDVTVIPIPETSFNHGEARNIGVRAAKGDWVILTVGDARATDEHWIEKLFDGLLDGKVVAVCGAQVVPHERDANPVYWFRPISAPNVRRVWFETSEEFDRLPPSEKLQACAWDNVTALYSREILLRIPFQPVMYAEDSLWAREALRSGCVLVYNPGARVNHYHFATPEFTFRRAILTLCVKYRSFGYKYPVPKLSSPLLRAARRLMLERTLTPAERLKWIRHTWKNQLAARSAVRAFNRALAEGPDTVDTFCSRYSDRPPVPDKFVTRANPGA